MSADGGYLETIGGWVDLDFFKALRSRVRARRAQALELHDNSEEAPRFQWCERFLQILWNERRFTRALRTSDGESLSIIKTGTWNVGAGPDFGDAVIRIGDSVRRGAVEIHREVADWRRHGHHLDSAYSNVILHVVWLANAANAGGPPGVPVLCLGEHLPQPWQVLLDEINGSDYPYAQQVAPGGCAANWAAVDDERLSRLLRVAGLARFDDKVLRLQRGMVAMGVGQALYEAMFEALGYKANREPFQALARQLPLKTLAELPDRLAREAALFGAAGLLPDPSLEKIDPTWQRRVTQLWDQWWQLGLPRLELNWSRRSTRPLNTIHRRLAAGLELLETSHCAPHRWFSDLAATVTTAPQLLHLLRESLRVRSRWEGFRTFGARIARPASLLGACRRQDVLVNVVLPFLVARSRRGGDSALVALAIEAYCAVPPLQGNRLLTEAIHRFLVPPSRAATVLGGACEQQGLIELYRSFCLSLESECENCPFVRGEPVAQPQLAEYSS